MSFSRLILGPIVGHTDEQSTRIWIRVGSKIEYFLVRVKGKGLFEVKSTNSEFGTGIAVVDGLRPDTTYDYDVTYKRKVILGSSGSFTTMPPHNSFQKITFVSISCNSVGQTGVWNDLKDFIAKAKPRFLIMMGDQLYLDNGEPDVWKDHIDSKPAKRREEIAEKYKQIWSQEPIRTIMKNIPTYMIWDDGDIRNGWGSYAIDSPTLANKYPQGKHIFQKSDSYFQDARHLYQHFQSSHNPKEPEFELDEEAENRYASPFYFYCGRLAVLVLDSRGARDLWRNSNPVLGDKQWNFIDNFLRNLGSDRQIDALAVITPTPIVATSPNGFQQKSLGHRTDDVEYFANGDEKNSFEILHRSSSHWWEKPAIIINRYIGSSIGYFQIEQLGDVRSQWSHSLSTKEQTKLIRMVSQVVSKNRNSRVKQITFIGGDLHVGGRLKIMVDNPQITAECLVTSGISSTVGLEAPAVPSFFDESFNIADDIKVKLDLLVRDYNFGVTQVIFAGNQTQLINDVAHKGWANYWKLILP